MAKSLNLQQAEAERWIIGLINDSKLDAKIDSASNHVEMEKTYPSIYSQIVSKTKHLTYQTHALHDQVRDYYGECKATAVAAAEERAQKAAALAAEQKRQADAKQEVCCVWCVGVFFEQWNQNLTVFFFSLIFFFYQAESKQQNMTMAQRLAAK